LVDYFKSLPSADPSLLRNERPLLLQSSTTQREEKITKHINKTEKSISLYFRIFSDIEYIIIPFFKKYSIRGYKKLDFLDFKNVAKIVKAKKHLTSKEFKEVETINSTMNLRRP
jgi:hypothetical protein